MRRALLLVAGFGLIATLSGCGTLECCSADDMEAWPIYGGVAHDLKDIQDTVVEAQNDRTPPPTWPVVITVARVVDLPLSAAADTLLLPVTVTYSVAKGMDRMDGAPVLSKQAWERFWGMEQPIPPPTPPRQGALPAIPAGLSGVSGR